MGFMLKEFCNIRNIGSNGPHCMGLYYIRYFKIPIQHVQYLFEIFASTNASPISMSAS